ncbi:DUF3971 domain-containing protein [Shimia sp.]|uniref:YhdP family protein n=1 Tax=Shimia sp. TaxID=1954381 RepID=UPI003297CE39
MFALVGLLVPVLALSVLALIAIDRPIIVPNWARQHIQNVLTRQLPGFTVELGEVSLVVEDNFDPFIRVRNLEVSAPDNAGTVELAQVESRLSFSALTDGQIAPRDVRVSGVFLTVIRQGDGTFNISVGSGGGTGAFREATQLATLGDQIEGYLDLPVLAQLDSFVLEDMTLRYEDVRAGQGWTVDSGLLRLVRAGDDVAISTQLSVLGGRDYVTSIEGFLNTSFLSTATQFGVSFEDMPSDGIASQTAALAWLEILRAPFSGSLRGETDEDGRLGPLNASLRIENGFLQPDDSVQPVPFERLGTYLTYDPAKESITFSELSLDSKWIRATASGQALLRDMELGLPKELLVQLELSRFEANPQELDDVPLVLDRSFADFRLKLDPFELTLGQLVLRHGGHRLQLSGALSTSESRWKYSVDGQADGLDTERLLPVWPVRIKPKLRTWITENIHQVTLSDINLAIRSQAEEPPDVYVDFQFSDAEVRFLKTMPPVRQASGYASLIRHQFRVGAESGIVTADQGGDVDVTGTGFIVENTRLKQSPARAEVKATSSVTAVMSLLDRDPLRVFTKAKLPVDMATGRADLNGEAQFVMKDKLPVEEVSYEARGILWDVRTSHFIKDKEIRADLHVHANNEMVELSGVGAVGSLPVDGRWHIMMGPEKSKTSWLKGSAELSARAVEEFNIGLPKGSVFGEGRGDFEIIFAAGETPSMSLTSDLQGVGLSAQPLGWRKKEDSTGTLEVAVTMDTPIKVDSLSLDTNGLKATGDITLRDTGGLDVMRLTSFEVGRWLKGTGELRGRGGNLAPAIAMTSGSFDMRYMPSSSGGSQRGAAPGPITARLDRVQVTDSIHLSNVSAELDLNNGVSGQFTGAFLGSAPMSGELSPHTYGTALKVTSPNGGQMATAMGVLASATRGALTMTLIPHQSSGVYDGTLSMRNLKVQRIPLIAELLNAISVIGLIEQLDGPGILFTDVFSRFRLTPNQLIIAEGSAAGPSMGVSADGTFTHETSQFDIQGVVSPIYAVNVIGRPISKRGEGLIGFNYTMRGPSSDPQISVNPLSVLTPGFFREIFRRPAPKLNN